MTNTLTSTLYMIETIVGLQKEVDKALKCDGHRELCLYADELDWLQELVGFLTHFKNFMDLLGVSLPTLSVASQTEDPKIKANQLAVLTKEDHRFPVSHRIKLGQ